MCLTFGGYTDSIKFKLTMNSKMEECSKVIVDCIDDWQYWTKVDAEWLDKCALSSGTEVTMYEWKPVTRTLGEEFYLFGEREYLDNYCWPGKWPISNVLLYADNPLWGLELAWKDLKNLWDDYSANGSAAAGWVP